MRLEGEISLQAFSAALRDNTLEMPQDVYNRLRAARTVVEAAAAGEAPVYGLNTGLGANLGHRIAAEDIPAFQRKLIEGRAVAVGPLLDPEVGRALMLARIVGAAQGHSGMSVSMFDHLCALWRAGIVPGIPQYGSIGASDLTQNACWAMVVLGGGQCWDGEEWRRTSDVFVAQGIDVPELEIKDGMALINHSGASVALAGIALEEARAGLAMMQHAAVLSCQGYAANRQIFQYDINALRAAPGQEEMAAWFLNQLSGSRPARKVQDALSFRTLAPVLGAAAEALGRAISIWQDELNGASDSPAVIGDQAMCSTSNFHTPALALALEQVSLALAMAASGAVMRVQRMMDPDLSGLARYLSPVGGASAGFVPLQKTAAALLGDIRRHAMPVVLDPPPVSDGVEDMAPMTPLAAQKLSDQMVPFHLLCGIEAIVAAQACDLRGCPPSALHGALRREVPFMNEDRPLGDDATRASRVLRRFQAATNDSAFNAEGG
ncbi:MAG: aromatic amino acid ammonia-lyase [Sulfitobacter sp.]